MTKRLKENVVPICNDKYYVYALFKPNSYNPFYVGKGIRNRINDHFKACNLVNNTPKTGVIKKYGNSIRREILCYFDKEESAYEFEEYLISVYGLESEGGCLVNYSKTRFEYSDRFVKNVSSLGHLSRKRKHNKETIIDALNKFYIERKPSDVVSRETGINVNYLLYVLSGKKCKYEFDEFASLNNFTIEHLDSVRLELIADKRSKSRTNAEDVPDEIIIREFNDVLLGKKTVVQSANDIGMSQTHLGSIFLGNSRAYLQLDYDSYRKNFLKGKAVPSLHIFNTVKSLFNQGLSVKEIKEQTGFGRTTIYRVIRKLTNTENAA